MFTGIVQSLGTVGDVTRHGNDLSLEIDLADLVTEKINIGDSIAVNGVCLTIVGFENGAARFDVSTETLSCSLLGSMQSGQKVNLELAMLPDTRFGGHIVSGHVDGLGVLMTTSADERSTRMTFSLEQALGKYIAPKGSICIDGISLTVNGVKDDDEHTHFDVNIVPHTLKVTTLGQLNTGRQVHIEVDMIARYLERLLNNSKT
ncbi:MAG: riboflavin synthase [Gammaproteobacteria bacterium]|nr:riboflavin synthase [Gammaproteobacteria bacterium]